MGNMIKLPYDEGAGNTGILALNVDGAIDVILNAADELYINYDVFSNVAGNFIQVQLTFTDNDLDQDDADALLATIKRASQAPNSQPTFQPGDNKIDGPAGITVTDVTP